MSGHQQNQPERQPKQQPPRGGAADLAAEPQFISAERHSRRVRALKIVLPILAVIAAAVFYWFTFMAAPKAGKIISLNNDQGEGNKLVMTAPKVAGFTKDGRPYAINADKAIQDPAKPGIIELRNISGTLPISDHGTAGITAAGAFFDNVNGRLHFDRPFTIITNDGTTLHFLSAEANLQSGQMDSKDKVEISSAARDLTAASMYVRNNGGLIHFSGRVHIILNKDGAPAGINKP